MSAKNKEKIKLEIAKIISENKECTKKIAHYRSVVNNTILDGCEGYSAWSDVLKNHDFVVIGTVADIIAWCGRHDLLITKPFLVNNVAPRGIGAHKLADLTITDIMSVRLLEWIDEEIYSIYNICPIPEGYANSNKNRLTNLTHIVKQKLDDVITYYITRHVFWASPCKAPNRFILHPWMRDWCKRPTETEALCKAAKEALLMTQTSQNYADENMFEAALIAQHSHDKPAAIQEAINKLNIAFDSYLYLKDYRRVGMAAVLLAELHGKKGPSQTVACFATCAINNLDQKLDAELINQCKELLSFMPQHSETSEKQGGSYQYDTNTPFSTPGTIHTQKSAGNSFPATSTASPLDLGQNGKPHILVTKPPMVVPIDHGNTKKKKRSETQKTSAKKMLLAKKTTPKKHEETEVDFVKAAVSGGLFKNKPDDSNT